MEYIISGEWIETMNLALDKLEMRLNPHECPQVIRCRDCVNGDKTKTKSQLAKLGLIWCCRHGEWVSPCAYCWLGREDL